jgi:hypothetical protein
MATIGRRTILAAALLVAITSTGCNLLALPFFVFPNLSNEKPKCKLASDDKDKEVRILILTSMGLETRPELVRFDSDLSRMLARNLSETFKNNKEKVTVVPTTKVEKYKDNHPDWQAIPVTKIAETFRADYVIDLEIESASLYDEGSSRALLKGKVAINIKVIDVKGVDDNRLKYEEEFRSEYPRTGPNDASNTDIAQFRQKFIAGAARQIAWKFVAHPFDDETSMRD